MAKVDLLAQFPQLGRVVPEEQDENVREVILPPYRIIYRAVAQDHVMAFARVWHGARGETEIPSPLEF